MQVRAEDSQDVIYQLEYQKYLLSSCALSRLSYGLPGLCWVFSILFTASLFPLPLPCPCTTLFPSCDTAENGGFGVVVGFSAGTTIVTVVDPVGPVDPGLDDDDDPVDAFDCF